MCTIADFLTDIRKSLNECEPSSESGCGCNDRYSDDDIISAVNSAITNIVSLRPDDFVEDVNVNIPAGECRVNICNAGCDIFQKVAYSQSDKCFIPEQVCTSEIGKSDSVWNKCFEYSSQNISDETVYQYNYDVKSPCFIVVDREDQSLPVDLVLECAVYPEPYGLNDELPEKICKKYHDYIYHQAMFHLIDRDHRNDQAFIQYAAMHRDTATIRMRDINESDRNFHSPNYMGEDIDSCN